MTSPRTPRNLRPALLWAAGLTVLAIALWSVTAFKARRNPSTSAEDSINQSRSNAVSTQRIDSLLNETPKPYILAQSLPLTGPAAHLGLSYSRGIDAALRQFNQAGGINGRPVKIWRLDDGYEPQRTINNTRLFTQRSEVLGLFGYVGTPTTKAILNQANEANLPIIAPMTGASSLRQSGQDNLAHYRSSYAQEANRIINHLVNDGYVRIAIAYQNDAYGKDVLASLRTALKRHGLQPASSVTLPRNSTRVSAAARTLHKSNPDALVVISTSETMGAVVSRLHHMGSHPQLMTISFVGTKALFNDLPQSASYGIGVTQVVPFPWDGRHPNVKRYQQVLQTQSNQPDFDFISLEGFLATEWLINALKSLGPQLNRSALINELKRTAPIQQGQGTQNVDLVFLGSGPWMP